MPQHKIPSYEEMYGIVDNYISDDEFSPEVKDEKLKEAVIIILGVLQDFYLNVQYYTDYEILTESFENKINSLNSDLKDIIKSLVNQYLEDYRSELDVEYLIPASEVDSTVNIDSVLDSAIDELTGSLKLSLDEKAHFYNDMAIVTGLFSLHSNFRESIKKLVNKVVYNSEYAKKVVKRRYDEFIYGQEALFTWNCSGRNTCAWCYSIEAMGARPLSEFPVDHPNGECEITPVNPDDYSYEYKLIRGWV